jgi:hypothetical protein
VKRFKYNNTDFCEVNWREKGNLMSKDIQMDQVQNIDKKQQPLIELINDSLDNLKQRVDILSSNQKLIQSELSDLKTNSINQIQEIITNTNQYHWSYYGPPSAPEASSLVSSNEPEPENSPIPISIKPKLHLLLILFLMTLITTFAFIYILAVNHNYSDKKNKYDMCLKDLKNPFKALFKSCYLPTILEVYLFYLCFID